MVLARLLSIDTTLPFPKLLVRLMMMLPQDQLVPAKKRLSRILEVPLVFSSSSPTALMSNNTEIWLRSAKVVSNLVSGAASTSSPESLPLPSLSSPLKTRRRSDRVYYLLRPRSKMPDRKFIPPKGYIGSFKQISRDRSESMSSQCCSKRTK